MESIDEVRFALDAKLSEDDLGLLFEEAWGPGSNQGYDKVLERSLCHVCAFRGAELIGFVNVGWDGGAHAFILDTAVLAAVRRKGIGLELVRQAIDFVRRSGVEWIHVDYEEHLDTFYEKAGLRPTKARLLHLKPQF